MLTPYAILRKRILDALAPIVITSATLEQDNQVLISVVVENETEAFTIDATLDGSPITLTGVTDRVYSFEYTLSGSAQTLEWTVTATNDNGTTVVTEELIIPASLSAPVLSNTSATVTNGVLTVSVTSAGTPTPSLSVSLDVDSSPETMSQVSPGVWTYAFTLGVAPIPYSGTVTATNGVSPNATFNFSGSAPAATVPGPSPTIPDAFLDSDWRITIPQPTLSVPDAFADTDWSIRVVPGDVLPPPSQTVGAPTNVQITSITDRGGRVTWSPPSSGTPARYDAQFALRGTTNWTTVTGVTSPFTLSSIPTGGQEYSVRIAAVDASNRPTYSSLVNFTTHWRAYGRNAEWNIPIAQTLSRGSHPNETYIRDIMWQGKGNPSGVNYINFFNRDYTYPVYRSRDATITANVNVGFGNWRTGRVPWNPAWRIPGDDDPSITDNQFVILDEETGIEYNAWRVRYNSSTNTIVNAPAGTGRVSQVTANPDETGGPGNWRTKENGFRPSRGPGLQYYALLITPEEIEQGKIYHAVGCVMRRSGHKYYVRPAYKGERISSNFEDQGVPQGTRFYFDVSDAEIDSFINGWPSGVPASTRRSMRIVFKAMQEYGIIANDNGGDNHIQFQHDASVDWGPYGLTFTGSNTDDNNLLVNGRGYPRDAIDNFISDKNRIKVVRPPDGILHYAEWQSDTPTPPRHFSGTIGGTNITDIGFPRISGGTSAGSVMSIARPAQFVGEHPVTVNWIWQVNGSDVSGTQNQSTYVRPSSSPVRTRWWATNNRGSSSSVTSNSI